MQNNHRKKALVLINLGTPDKPQIRDVHRYLREFLGDGRIIDIPWIIRKILVNLVIIPLRVRSSTKLYKRLWTDKGSPLLYYLHGLKSKLEDRMGNDFEIFAAMRYGNPSIRSVLNEVKQGNFEEVIFLPLFPHYASSTVGSIVEKLFKEMRSWEILPPFRMINQFYQHEEFISAFSNQILRYEPQNYDHIVFSYHGLPDRHIDKAHDFKSNYQCNCEEGLSDNGIFCYKSACYHTTKLFVEKIGLTDENYSVGFQSRLSKNWLTPFTDELITELAKNGKKNILIVAPSFVADCLETIVELEYEYKNIFLDSGGENLTLVKSLNDTDEWADAVVKIVSG